MAPMGCSTWRSETSAPSADRVVANDVRGRADAGMLGRVDNQACGGGREGCPAAWAKIKSIIHVWQLNENPWSILAAFGIR